MSRLMTKAEAAAHCGLKSSAFSDWIKAGRIPGPIAGTRRWDRVALDAALDKLSGLRPTKSDQSDADDEADVWLRANGHLSICSAENAERC